MILLIHLAIFVCVGLAYKALRSLETLSCKPVLWARTVWYATAGAAIASTLYNFLPMLGI